jgi:hypothetical protein
MPLPAKKGNSPTGLSCNHKSWHSTSARLRVWQCSDREAGRLGVGSVWQKSSRVTDDFEKQDNALKSVAGVPERGGFLSLTLIRQVNTNK